MKSQNFDIVTAIRETRTNSQKINVKMMRELVIVWTWKISLRSKKMKKMEITSKTVKHLNHEKMAYQYIKIIKMLLVTVWGNIKKDGNCQIR